MKKLGVKNYYKALNPIEKLSFNILFAKSIIKGDITGDIYVDDIENPTVFYVVHPYGMSLLYGEWKNEEFLIQLKNYMLNNKNQRTNYEWLQAYPKNWDVLIKDMMGDKMIPYEELDDGVDPYKVDDIVVKSMRINFNFNKDRYKAATKDLDFSQYKIIPTTKEMFDKIEGSVIPKYFWDDAQHFEIGGKGFSLLIGDNIASTVFSSFSALGNIEIGIETLEDYQGNGYAFLVCCKMIEYCLENDLEPIWSCNKINVGSQALANKLGFDKTVTLPYYKLINS